MEIEEQLAIRRQLFLSFVNSTLSNQARFLKAEVTFARDNDMIKHTNPKRQRGTSYHEASARTFSVGLAHASG
jgi:hypothetical protein